MAEARAVKIQRALSRIAQIREQFLAIDLICPGTISRRMRRCGKPCRCAKDPAALHGPYYEWTHVDRGRFRNERLSAEAAKRYAAAIANLRLVRRLLKQWERESRRLLDQPQ